MLSWFIGNTTAGSVVVNETVLISGLSTMESCVALKITESCGDASELKTNWLVESEKSE